ncbi:MAG: metallophosphoesterase family protein [Chloroflexota bacterium]|nr:metallophosphoesterase family protein [Chloroflexota bacterium]
MRLAVISDIHGNVAALEIALADLQAAGGADRLWVLGDHAWGGPRPVECIQRLQSLTTEWGENNISFIRGNTDRYLVTGAPPTGKAADSAESYAKLAPALRAVTANIDWLLTKLSYAEYEWLTKLRGELDLDVPGYGGVIGYHGTPGNDEGYLKPDTPLDEADDALLDREGRLGIGGHIHQQMDRDLTRWRAINVGSVGMSFDKPGYVEYGIFTFEGSDVQVDLRAIAYDVELVIADLQASGYPGWEQTARRLREGM